MMAVLWCILLRKIAIPNEEASKYVAIIEGQHRYTAAKETDLNEEMLFLYECYSDKDTNEILAETNTVTDPWSGADYANGAALFNPPKMSWQNLQKNLPI